MKLLNKKGQILGNLQGAVMAFITIGVIIAVGLYVLSQLQSTVTVNSSTNCAGVGGYWNSTSGICQESASVGTALSDASATSVGTMITKIGTAPTWIGILITVIFASAVLAYFYFK